MPLLSHFNPENFTIAAFDNFDHEECTLSGIGGTHDTVAVLFQDKPIQALRKPNITESLIEHGSKVFNVELPCQEFKEFLKPSRKPELPNEFVVSTSLHPVDYALQQNIKMKSMAWSLSRLDHSDTNNETPKATCDQQAMPSWNAFNSVISEETFNERIVGFIALIPYPVTECTTVYTALKNFQEMQCQLNKSHLPITCDEGVYRIAGEIMLMRHCIGSFHMAKILLGCLGNYLRGGGAENIWIENLVFGINVVQTVLGETHYTCSHAAIILKQCRGFSGVSSSKYMVARNISNNSVF